MLANCDEQHDFLLLENGDNLLLESGDEALLDGGVHQEVGALPFTLLGIAPTVDTSP
jgi:hypothetical protein